MSYVAMSSAPAASGLSDKELAKKYYDYKDEIAGHNDRVFKMDKKIRDRAIITGALVMIIIFIATRPADSKSADSKSADSKSADPKKSTYMNRLYPDMQKAYSGNMYNNMAPFTA